MCRQPGFTLAELLIALGILGVIAVFTIPKVLSGQQDRKFNSIAKEASAAVSGAYDAYRLETAPLSSTSMHSLTPYLNYIKLDTTSTIDHVPPGDASISCTTTPCYLLHNGAILWFWGNTFGGTSNTHAIQFNIDPDGQYLGDSTGSGKSVQLFLYFNGRITDRTGIYNPTSVNGGSLAPDTITGTPDWFGWER